MCFVTIFLFRQQALMRIFSFKGISTNKRERSTPQRNLKISSFGFRNFNAPFEYW